MNNKFKPTRERFERSARSWFGWYSFWLYLHYIVGLLIVVFSGLVAASVEILGHDLTGLFGAIAGILAACVTFLRPNEKAATFRARWYLLNKALLEPTNKDVSKLYDAYIQAEAISNGTVFNIEGGE